MAAWWRPGSIGALSLALLVACSSSQSDEPSDCTPNQFRACNAGCGTERGVQQCVEVGEGTGRWEWSACACVVLDGGFVQAGGAAQGGEAGAGGALNEPADPVAGAAGKPGGAAGGSDAG